METFKLDDFFYNQVNMTGYRMVDSEDEVVQGTLDEMEKFQAYGHNIVNTSRVIKVGDKIQIFYNKNTVRFILYLQKNNLRRFGIGAQVSPSRIKLD